VSVAGTPYAMGTNTPSTAAVQIVTITTASNPQDSVHIFIGTTSTSDTITSVNDTAGNSYTLQNSNGATLGAFHYTCFSASQLVVGAQVYVSFSGTAATKDLSIVGCTGLASLDKINHTSGTGTSPSDNTGGALGFAPEVVFSAFVYNTATLSAFTFTTLSTQANMTVGYAISPSRAQVSVSATLSGSVAFNTIIESMVPTVYAPPAVPVFPAGYGALPVNMDTWIQQSLGFAAQTSVFRALQTQAQALNNAATTTLTFDTILEDPTGSWSSAGTGSQAANSWLAPWTGWYEINFGWQYTTAATVYVSSDILVDGLTPEYTLGACNGETGTTASYIVPLVGGVDYVQMLAFINTSAKNTASALSVGQQANCEITFIST
jgi:hypothetical protein